MERLIERLKNRDVIIICGHYGSGKTNLAVNLALWLKRLRGGRVTLADIDVVNPFFRSSDSAAALHSAGIGLSVPVMAITNSVAVTLSPLSLGGGITVADVGGDSKGAAALGVYAERIREYDYEMICVVNKYRPLTKTPEAAAGIAAGIEAASGLSFSSLVNNSSVGSATAKGDVLASAEYARRAAEIIGVPLIGTGVFGDLGFSESEIAANGIFVMENHTRSMF